jgi:hypothetical protein
LRQHYQAFADAGATDYNPHFCDYSFGVPMKSARFSFDRRLYEILQEDGLTSFTTRELRDGYARRLENIEFRIGDVRRYVYEQIRRMVRMGWVKLDEDRLSRGQIYHLQSVPADLQLELIENGFENSLKTVAASEPACVDEDAQTQLESTASTDEHLASLHKEIRLDFLSSMGETERFKLLLDEMPHLRGRVEGQYLEARDRSSRLLGHLRAIEKTLKTLAAEQ